MAFLDGPTFCSALEYANGLPQRVSEGELRNDEIYSVVIRLQSERREAAKLAARPLEIVHKTGMSIVKLMFLNRDLNPERETEAVVANGLVSRFKDMMIKDQENEDRFRITQAYFKDYFDDQFGEYLDTSTELSLTAC